MKGELRNYDSITRKSIIQCICVCLLQIALAEDLEVTDQKNELPIQRHAQNE